MFALDAACELAVAVDADGSNASGGVLVRAQNFSCDWDAFNAMDGARGAELVRLTIRAGGVRDLAVPPNAIFGVGPVFETSPFCGPCESGRFQRRAARRCLTPFVRIAPLARRCTRPAATTRSQSVTANTILRVLFAVSARRVRSTTGSGATTRWAVTACAYRAQPVA